MCQSSNSCCQDYSLLTGNTGIAVVSTANPNLDGSGTIVDVVTAGQLGAIVKSVTIKAIAPVTSGMVRLYIKTGSPATYVLYKEVPVPVAPVLSNTPTPTPVLPMFETILVGDLKLKAGDALAASTQTANSFVILADACNWEYPQELPTDCCNFKQVSAWTEAKKIELANTALNGTGAIVSIFTASNAGTTKGTRTKSVTIKALQSTSINGMVRLFISNDGGTTYRLFREIPVPETNQSAYEPSFKQVVDLDLSLTAGLVIGASTQNAEKFAITIEGEEWSYPI